MKEMLVCRRCGNVSKFTARKVRRQDVEVNRNGEVITCGEFRDSIEGYRCPTCNMEVHFSKDLRQPFKRTCSTCTDFLICKCGQDDPEHFWTCWYCGDVHDIEYYPGSCLGVKERNRIKS